MNFQCEKGNRYNWMPWKHVREMGDTEMWECVYTQRQEQSRREGELTHTNTEMALSKSARVEWLKHGRVVFPNICLPLRPDS